MHSNGTNITKSIFEEKYDLYSSMLYRFGFLYLASDEYIIEAMQEAFAWLFSRKKGFKTPAQEKLHLLRNMMLICEKRSKEFLENLHVSRDENAYPSEASELLEAIDGLPKRYQSRMCLYFCDNLNLSEMSKLLYIVKPVIKKRIAKALELMEMVMEKNLDNTYRCNFLDILQLNPNTKAELYIYLTKPHHVKRYFSSLQKAMACITITAMIVSSAAFVHFYPQIRPAAITKYAFLNGTICSVTLNSTEITCDNGVLLTDDNGEGHAYTIIDGSLKQLEAKHICGCFDYLGKSIPIDIYCYEKNNSLVVVNKTTFYDYPYLTFQSIKGDAESILVTLHWGSEALFPYLYAYPLLLNINTMQTTDFLSFCNISSLGKIRHANINDDTTAAIVMDENESIYYCNINTSSIDKICHLGLDNLYPLEFCHDGTVLYTIYTGTTGTTGTTGIPGITSWDDSITTYYKYSPSSGTSKQVFQYSHSQHAIAGSSHVLVFKGDDSSYIIMDISSDERTTISIPDTPEDNLTLRTTESPDGKNIIFAFYNYHNLDSKILNNVSIYNTETKEMTDLKLSDYKGICFDSVFWYDNDHVALIKGKAIPVGSNSYHLQTDNTKPGQTTLWIFNIKRLH